LLTRTTDRPEATAESNAKADPIIAFLEDDGVLKQIFSICALLMDAVNALCLLIHG